MFAFLQSCGKIRVAGPHINPIDGGGKTINASKSFFICWCDFYKFVTPPPIFFILHPYKKKILFKTFVWKYCAFNLNDLRPQSRICKNQDLQRSSRNIRVMGPAGCKEVLVQSWLRYSDVSFTCILVLWDCEVFYWWLCTMKNLRWLAATTNRCLSVSSLCCSCFVKNVSLHLDPDGNNAASQSLP